MKIISNFNQEVPAGKTKVSFMKCGEDAILKIKLASFNVIFAEYSEYEAAL
ncbi:MAG: hypothetical protein JKY48_02710 [Flavobacteriales bacterium]|nr:hypothetical protein [Flavobacteriales bacterium]